MVIHRLLIIGTCFIADEKMSIAKNTCQMKRYMGTCSNTENAARSSLFSIYQTKLISDYITER